MPIERSEHATLAALCVVAKRAYQGDKSANAELRLLGECLAFVGGFEAMQKLSGELHDYEIENRQAPYRVAGMLSANWEHIAVWANA